MGKERILGARSQQRGGRCQEDELGSFLAVLTFVICLPCTVVIITIIVINPTAHWELLHVLGTRVSSLKTHSKLQQLDLLLFPLYR